MPPLLTVSTPQAWAVVLLLGLASASLMAQEQPAAQEAPADATPKVQGTELKAVEIRANRETEERRQSTAAMRVARSR